MAFEETYPVVQTAVDEHVPLASRTYVGLQTVQELTIAELHAWQLASWHEDTQTIAEVVVGGTEAYPTVHVDDDAQVLLAIKK